MRQLENAVFRAVVLCEGDEIGLAEFPQIAAQTASFDALGALGVQSGPPAVPKQDPIVTPLIFESEPGLSAVIASPTLVPAPQTTGMLRLLDENGEMLPLDAIESEAIRFAIAHYRGQMSEVARKLRIGRSTLYRKLEGLGLASDGARDGADVAAK